MNFIHHPKCIYYLYIATINSYCCSLFVYALALNFSLRGCKGSGKVPNMQEVCHNTLIVRRVNRLLWPLL
jgi:hypothetical protein